MNTVAQWLGAARAHPWGDAVIALTVFGLIVAVQPLKPDGWRGQLLNQHMTMSAGVVLAVGLGWLDELIANLAGCGLRVDREVTGTLAALPTAVDVTAYRIVQEALTNVHKHARTDLARLRLGVDRETVRIVVDDGTGSAPGTGHGVLGMPERAAAVDGSLSAGPRVGDGFRVVAVLPVPFATEGQGTPSCD